MADRIAQLLRRRVRAELWEHAGRIEARIIVTDLDAEPLSRSPLERTTGQEETESGPATGRGG